MLGYFQLRECLKKSDKASVDDITPVEAEQPEEGWCCCNYWRLVLLSVSS